MPARPNEIKALSAILMEPAEDVREVAKACILALEEARTERVDYLVCRQMGSLADAHGPYQTYAQAQKAIEGGKIPHIEGTRFFIIPLRHPTQAEKALAKADEPTVSPEALAIWEAARKGGIPAKTHSRRNRRRAA